MFYAHILLLALNAWVAMPTLFIPAFGNISFGMAAVIGIAIYFTTNKYDAFHEQSEIFTHIYVAQSFSPIIYN